MPLRPWVLGVSLLVLVAAACDGGESQTSPGERADVVLPTSPGALPDYDFEAYAALLRELRGTPVVVNVWASWCGPCRDEAPALAAASAEYDGRVQFLGLDVLDARPDARAFIERYGWPYPSLFDQTGAIRDRLGLVGQPVTVFYDASGNLVETHTGAVSASLLTEQLEALLSTG